MASTFNSERMSRAHTGRRVMFWDALDGHADRVAGIDDLGNSITYAELAARADAVAARIGRGRQLVLLEAANTIEWLVAYVGALRGRHAILMAPNGDDATRQALETRFGPAFRLTAARGYFPEAVVKNASLKLHSELALLLSTSGSTGSKKLVRLSRTNLASNADSIAEFLDLSPADRGAANLPTHYSYGLSIVNSHLAAGSTVLLTSSSVIDPQFWAFLRKHKGTSFAGVPHVYDLLQRVDFVDSAPPTLRYFTQAGGRLQPETAAMFAKIANDNAWRFFVMYGQTEATARIAYLPPEHVLEHPDCVGVAVPEGQLELIDESGHPIRTADTDGELVYRGPNVMMGYASTPDELASPPQLDRLATGDLARLTDTGFYRITGRRSRFIKVLGNRIGLDDVEALLSSQGYQAIATGIDDHLLVVSTQADALPAVRDFLAERLNFPAAYMEFRAVDQYPLLSTGKIDYAGLKASIQPRREALSVEAGKNSDATVLAAFTRAFGDSALNDSESFTSLGGDSLNYVLVVLALEQLIPDLPPNWESMPIAALRTLAARQVADARLPTMESSVLLRSLAILAVVFGHSSPYGLVGGSSVLMLLVGHNLVRFRIPAMLSGDVWINIWNYLKKLLVPYVLLNLLYMIEKHHIELVGLTATSNFWGPDASPSLFPQWFLEVAVQCVLIIGALLSIPWARKAVARAPFMALFAFLAIATAARFTIPLVWNTDALYNRVPWMYLPLFFIAWMITLVRNNRERLAISAAALAYYILRGYAAGANSSLIAVSTATLVLLWIPRVPLPGTLRDLASVPAAAVFYIYMLHELFMHIPRTILHWNNGAALFAFGIGGPVLTWWLVETMGIKRWAQDQRGWIAKLISIRGALSRAR